jgi:hypothetical protein
VNVTLASPRRGGVLSSLGSADAYRRVWWVFFLLGLLVCGLVAIYSSPWPALVELVVPLGALGGVVVLSRTPLVGEVRQPAVVVGLRAGVGVLGLIGLGHLGSWGFAAAALLLLSSPAALRAAPDLGARLGALRPHG